MKKPFWKTTVGKIAIALGKTALGGIFMKNSQKQMQKVGIL